MVSAEKNLPDTFDPATGKKPDAARLFVFDTQKQQIAGSFAPFADRASTGRIGHRRHQGGIRPAALEVPCRVALVPPSPMLIAGHRPVLGPWQLTSHPNAVRPMTSASYFRHPQLRWDGLA